MQESDPLIGNAEPDHNPGYCELLFWEKSFYFLFPFSVQSVDYITAYPQTDVYKLSTIEECPGSEYSFSFFSSVLCQNSTEYLRSPHILNGYRVHFSLRLCLLSLFRLHNETGNVYTHLLGGLAFVGMYGFIFTHYIQGYKTWSHFLIITFYMVCVAWLLMCSATFHLFNCASPSSYACTARLDYSGIGLVILMSQWGAMVVCFIYFLFSFSYLKADFISLLIYALYISHYIAYCFNQVYAFYCWPVPLYVFAGMLGFFTLVVVLGPMFSFFHHRRLRMIRAVLYIVLSVVLPLCWWLMCGLRYGFLSRAVVYQFYLGMALCYAGYAFGMFFYATRFPERLWPGRFDYLCGSHSLWHVGVVLGASILLLNFIHVSSFIADNTCQQLDDGWYASYYAPYPPLHQNKTLFN